MTLNSQKLSDAIRQGNSLDAAGFAVVPSPNLEDLQKGGEASITLRLGRWFVVMRPTNDTFVNTVHEKSARDQRLTKQYFVPFGTEFVLHPNRFVLASTLEWIRVPSTLVAFVVGKSRLARRGIIIETAAGVHPGFSGCLTLEIANVGEVPVKLVAGMSICQLFVHRLEGDGGVAETQLSGQRKPRLGEIKEDAILEKLIKTRL